MDKQALEATREIIAEGKFDIQRILMDIFDHLISKEAVIHELDLELVQEHGGIDQNPLDSFSKLTELKEKWEEPKERVYTKSEDGNSTRS